MVQEAPAWATAIAEHCHLDRLKLIWNHVKLSDI
jgi:hypothetical protein